MTLSEKKPPRVFGVLLALMGLLLSIGGVSLILQGDNAYFLLAGFGILISGALIALGKMIGAWIYLSIFAVMAIWSVIETGLDMGQLLPRLLLPAIFCAYIFSNRIRLRLS